MGPRSGWGALGAVLVSWAVCGGADAADTQGQGCPPPIVRTDDDLTKARKAVERVEEQLQDVRLKHLRKPNAGYAKRIEQLERELETAKLNYDFIAKERNLYDRLLALCDTDDEKPAPRPQASSGNSAPPSSQVHGGQTPGVGPAPKPDPKTPPSGTTPGGGPSKTADTPGGGRNPGAREAKPAADPKPGPAPPGTVPISYTTPTLAGFAEADTSVACTFGGASVPLFIGPGGLTGPSSLVAANNPEDTEPARRFSTLAGYALDSALADDGLDDDGLDDGQVAGLGSSRLGARFRLLNELGLPSSAADVAAAAIPDRLRLAGLDELPAGDADVRERGGGDLLPLRFGRGYSTWDVPDGASGDGTGDELPPAEVPVGTASRGTAGNNLPANKVEDVGISTPLGFPVVIKAYHTVVNNGQHAYRPLPQAQLMLTFSAAPSLPGQGPRDVDGDAGQPPLKLVTDAGGRAATLATGRLLPRTSGYDSPPVSNRFRDSFQFSYQPSTINLDVTPRRGMIIAFTDTVPASTPGSARSRFVQQLYRQYLPPPLQDHVSDAFVVGNTPIVSLSYPIHLDNLVQAGIESAHNVLFSEPNRCVTIQGAPNDPMFQSKSSWKQPYDDQWAIKRVGFTSAPGSAWDQTKGARPVVVAVIDTGLDWNHEDIAWESLWTNPKEVAGNGVDDDKNGFVDDTLGWDFWRQTNLPWDRNGHGTFVAGIIAATSGNGIGIAGINAQAKIMVIKALNSFGHGRASHLAQSIVYAVDNGAQVVNISVGGKGRTRTEQLAVEYAHKKGVVIVVSAGNEGTSDEFGPGGVNEVITVGATDLNDKRSIYSNWGPRLDISAPGDDVLGPRARLTDLMLGIPGIEYKEGDAIVGTTRRYYRASGTSFAAPIVAGIASLIVGQRPGIAPDQVKRMIVHSARDLDVAGVDQYTGYGLVDAVAALGASPDFFVEAGIAAVTATQKSGRTYVQVTGTADADALKGAWIEIGAGDSPTEWKKVSRTLERPVRSGVLDEIDAESFRASKKWTLRLITEHKKGQRREARFLLNLG